MISRPFWRNTADFDGPSSPGFDCFRIYEKEMPSFCACCRGETDGGFLFLVGPEAIDIGGTAEIAGIGGWRECRCSNHSLSRQRRRRKDPFLSAGKDEWVR